MRNIGWALLIVAWVGLSLAPGESMGQGALEPTGAPAPTMKTMQEIYDVSRSAEPRIAINSNNTPGDTNYYYRITNSGSYYMTGNLAIASEQGGIEIVANDVTFDLNGYTLSGNGAGSYEGIHIGTQTNVEIRNGSVRSFGGNGIYGSFYESAVRVKNVRVYENYYGILLQGRNNLIVDCSAETNRSTGIDIGSYSRIDGCVASRNGSSGISAGDGSTLIGNTASENTGVGVSGGVGSTIMNNTARGSTYVGIYGAYGCNIRFNTVYGNGSSGIRTSHRCLIEGNAVNENNADGDPSEGGIFVPAGCMVRGNNLDYNSVQGVYVYNTGNCIEENRIGNSVYGVYFRLGGSFYANNRFTSITTNAVYNSAGQTDGGGNVTF